MSADDPVRVLRALSEDRISTVTKEDLISAFNDDGLYDLEGIAEHIVKRLQYDVELEKSQPRHCDFALLANLDRPRDEPSEHVVPEVPFVLDGTTYDPADITRFDGQDLVFVPVTEGSRPTLLHAFTSESAQFISGYLQARHVLHAIDVRDYGYPGTPPGPGLGTPPGPGGPGYVPPTLGGCGGNTGIPCGKSKEDIPGGPGKPIGDPPPPNYPTTIGQVQMFDGGYSGNWFWLARDYMWTDLTMAHRGGLFGGDWNDEIFSTSATNTWCLYAEHINFVGSRLLIPPYRPLENLSVLGWHNRISSVWNYNLT